MNSYTTLNGFVIEFDKLSKPEAAFLARAQAASEDPKVSTDQLIALIYGPENPILDSSLGHPMVTARTLEHPLFRILSDLIGVKRVQLGQLDLDQAHARYTMDVPTAAAQLGITQQAIRAAIDSSRLPALFRNGQWWLTAESIDNFQKSKRGRPAKVLEVGKDEVSFCMGSIPGASLSIKVDEGIETKSKAGGLLKGRFKPGWKRALVKMTTEDGTRVYEIEEGTGAGNREEHHGMFVEGAFEVVKKYNNSKRAMEAWREGL
jgi:hypothetical protein